MQPVPALETNDLEPKAEAEETPVTGEFVVLAASESALAAEKSESGSIGAEDRHLGHGTEAEFMLESTAVCPHCLEDIDKVQIVRMLRTKVNFVSSLPRRGQLLICPKCRIALAGALGGLI